MALVGWLKRGVGAVLLAGLAALAGMLPLSAWSQVPVTADLPMVDPAVTPAAMEVDLSDPRREALIDALTASLQQLEVGLEAVDPAPASDWLAASPIDRLQARLEAAIEGSPEQALWRAAIEHEQAGSARIEGALERVQAAAAAPDKVAELIGRLNDLPPLPVSSRLSVSSLGALEESVQRATSELTQRMLDIEQRRALMERLDAQSRAQAEIIERLRWEGDAEFAEPPVPVDAALAESEAYGDWVLTRDRRLEARLLAARIDGLSLPVRLDLLAAELPALEFIAAWIQRHRDRLSAHLAERANEELRALRAEILRVFEFDPAVQPALSPPLETLLANVELTADWQRRARDLQLRQQRDAALAEDLAQALGALQERLELGGVSDALGRFLQEESRRVRQLGMLRSALQEMQRESSQARLRELTLRQTLRDLEQQAALRPDEGAVARWARLHRSTVETQLQANSQLTQALEQAQVFLALAVREVDALEQLINESLLWWPSHGPIGSGWLTGWRLLPGLLVDTQGWLGLRTALSAATVQRPPVILITLLAMIGLWLLGRRAPGRLADLADRTRHRFTDRMSLTVQALGWTLVQVAPVPLGLLALGTSLAWLPDAGSPVEVVSGALLLLAGWWLFVHLFDRLGSEHGVGCAHLGWSPVVVARLRRELAWCFPVFVLTLTAVAVSFGHDDPLVGDLLGRSLLVLLILAPAVCLWRLSDPRVGLVSGDRAAGHRRWLRLTAVGLTLTVALLAGAGYLLTILTLLGRLAVSLLVVALGWFVFRLALRALLLGETRLLIRRMREQRAKAAIPGQGPSVGEGAVLDLPETAMSVEHVNQQTRRLLRVSVIGSLVLALLWAWADVLPALVWLDGVTLWTRTVVVGDTELVSRVSLQAVLLAVLLGVLLTLAARNLPGLVEILLARSTHMDAAGRYTVTTLLRYALAVVAVISVFSLLGLRWSELQWLVAALTLGLGFGLQEVVANFVSGIIMLFERPVRVGDTITIGEYSGTVARIRTRATTIVDWDNREIVVPNKTFITERLINWTLTDTMTRVVIPVGVSYGSDIEEVMTTLQVIAERCPQVLAEPPPQVLFLRLGQSTLDFELRVYVNLLRERLETTSLLLTEVVREFRARGIEIAFPQLDLHVRSVDPALAGLREAR